jgi:K+-transporting ATPase c subunit
MKKALLIALRTTVITLVLTGIIYPFVITGLAQILFSWRANGSLVTDECGQVVGSELIRRVPRPQVRATTQRHHRIPISDRLQKNYKIG